MGDTLDDSVQRQVVAYHDHDVDALVGCYSDDVVIEDGLGQLSVQGREQLRQRYTAFFAAAPAARAEITSRIRVGSYVIDEERVSGLPTGDLHAAVVYRLGPDGLIEHVRVLT